MAAMKRLYSSGAKRPPIAEAVAAAAPRARPAAPAFSPALLELRERLGPPSPPPVNTGWYECGDGFYRIAGGPYPEYRYPGLAWKRRWPEPKPDDVPWEDADLVVANEPTPPRLTGGRMLQGSLFS